MGKLIDIAFVVAVVVLFGYSFWIFWKNREIKAVVCGHKTKISDWVEAAGERVKIKVPVKNGKTLYCHKCLEKMTIRCARCSLPIFIASPITLYSPRGNDNEMPDYAVPASKEDNSYVSCLRWKCAEIGADRDGFWYPPGEVHRVPSIFEMSPRDILRYIKRRGSRFVIVKDLSKP